jgi:hypothetical protein
MRTVRQWTSWHSEPQKCFLLVQFPYTFGRIGVMILCMARAQDPERDSDVPKVTQGRERKTTALSGGASKNGPRVY